MAKKQGTSYDSIERDVKAGHFKPFYLLMGKESFFIDKLTDLIINSALKEEQKDFNLINFFGIDVDVSNVITTSKGFPMMSDHLVVVVREAQKLQRIDDLHYYLEKLQPSTILILCYKNGTVDMRSKMVSLAKKKGDIFVSNSLYDNKIPTFILNYAKSKNISIDHKAASMLADFVGADLSRVASEFDKLIISLPASSREIFPEQIEKYIGVSKDYNNFELQEALVNKNILKANRIINYFEKNSKRNPIQLTVSVLFNFYSALMLAYYSSDKSPQGLSTFLGMNYWQVDRNIIPALRNYSATKTLRIISAIRTTDAKSKGVGSSSTSSADLLRELVFFILH